MIPRFLPFYTMPRRPFLCPLRNIFTTTLVILAVSICYPSEALAMSEKGQLLLDQLKRRFEPSVAPNANEGETSELISPPPLLAPPPEMGKGSPDPNPSESGSSLDVSGAAASEFEEKSERKSSLQDREKGKKKRGRKGKDASAPKEPDSEKNVGEKVPPGKEITSGKGKKTRDGGRSPKGGKDDVAPKSDFAERIARIKREHSLSHGSGAPSEEGGLISPPNPPWLGSPSRQEKDESGIPPKSKPELPSGKQPEVEPSGDSGNPADDNPAPVVPASGKKVGEYRSFAEITDEELIQYAREHLWPAEKARKHNPPPTPPYRPKKRKSTDEKASAKEDSQGKKSSAKPASDKKSQTGTQNPKKKSRKSGK